MNKREQITNMKVDKNCPVDAQHVEDQALTTADPLDKNCPLINHSPAQLVLTRAIEARVTPQGRPATDRQLRVMRRDLAMLAVRRGRHLRAYVRQGVPSGTDVMDMCAGMYKDYVAVANLRSATRTSGNSVPNSNDYLTEI